MTKNKKKGTEQQPWGVLLPSLTNALFNESLYKNNRQFQHYYLMLLEMALSRFEWFNLPDDINERFLEWCLVTTGGCILFRDDDLADDDDPENTGFLSLRFTYANGSLDVYRDPIYRSAIADNGYQNADLNKNNSVIVYNNRLKTPCETALRLYAERLSNIDRTIDVNINAQKTPLIIVVNEQSQRLTLENLYKKYIGNEDVVFVDKGLNSESIKVLKTDAPFIANQLMELKTAIWNEVLTYLGVGNTMVQKKERLIRDEMQSNMGGVFANRFAPLAERQTAAAKFNKMFNQNVRVDFRSDETIPSKSIETDTIEGHGDLYGINRQLPNEMRDDGNE